MPDCPAEVLKHNREDQVQCLGTINQTDTRNVVNMCITRIMHIEGRPLKFRRDNACQTGTPRQSETPLFRKLKRNVYLKKRRFFRNKTNVY